MTAGNAGPATTDEVGVRYEQDGPVATVTLCRPDVLNAQTPAMWTELGNISRKLPGDVRVVIVRAEGRAFSAGLDLSVARGDGDSSLSRLAQLSATECADRIAGFQTAFTWLRSPSIVTIAAVQGHAIGAGFQLALNCDMRVLADDARFSMAEVTLGLVPDLGGTKRLTELVGPSRALEICVTGRRITADEADRIGLATTVVARADLDATVSDLAAAVLAADRGAVAEIKALLAGAPLRSYAEQDRAEREAQTRRLSELLGSGE
ncbi:enoyl-CoA hydratase/isomerase family protein [Actinoplanes xinjiangensis]|uniref:Enoyl-CoA hydratase/carnithine racemase n=1 Tax=Actinoplanes xinjiangensis TaxID=512350 RepID=A0A316EIF8_9ACTN|nr:enoyl-CoA hydratase/isomerase family protein [Actinoplanes xinjiangensis]PWK30644.1 enoyl-CoA hydratase/carnithine racemase [Actinoplanes xinjiangensis]GIF44332.1 enoyl-CoA hydratase [Actinoplanes xinjiangensis]